MKNLIIILVYILTFAIFAEDIDKGNFKFTPYITSYNEYNSNFFSSTEDQAGIIMLKILPGIKLENRNNKETDVKFSLNTSYMHYISLNENYNDSVSNNNDFDLNGLLKLAFFKKGNLSIYINENFSKTTYSGSSKPINKFINSLNLGLQTTPFGKALRFKLGYRFNFNKTIFTDDLSVLSRTAFEAQDNMEHIFNFDIEHRFLPKTSLLLTTSYGITSHYNADATSAASFNIVDSTPISSKIGLLGVITPKLALRLLLGWAYVIYDSGTNFNSFVSNIEFTYSFSKKTSFVLGFENSFKDVLFSNYLGYYNLYIKNDISLTNSFSLGFNIDAILNSYTGISLGNSVTSPSERTDINLELSGLLSYNYKERYKTELKYTMTKVITDFTTEYEGVTTNYDYLQHKVAINFFIFF